MRRAQIQVCNLTAAQKLEDSRDRRIGPCIHQVLRQSPLLINKDLFSGHTYQGKFQTETRELIAISLHLEGY